MSLKALDYEGLIIYDEMSKEYIEERFSTYFSASNLSLDETFSIETNNITYLNHWDFTNGNIDSITGNAATLNNCVTNSNGLIIDSTDDNCILGSVFNVGYTMEIDVASSSANFDTSTHGRFIMIYSSNYDRSEGLVWRHQTQSWAFYVDGAWDIDLPITDRDYFSGKTIKIVSNNEGYLTLYANDEFIATTSLPFDNLHNFICIGGYANSFTDITITSIRIYKEV